MSDSIHAENPATRGSLAWLAAGFGGGIAIAVALFGALHLLLNVGDNAVEPAVDAYFASLNAGEIEQLYVGAHSMLTEATTAEKFAEGTQLVRDKLGAYQSKTLRGINITADRTGVITHAVYDTDFANGSATVDFSFSGLGDGLKFAGADYRSDLLPSAERGRRRR